MEAAATQSFADVHAGIREFDRHMSEISSSMQEQHRGVVYVNSSMAKIERTTQLNAGSAEETAEAAEELSRQSQALGQVVDALRALVEGGKRVAPPTAVASAAEAWAESAPDTGYGEFAEAMAPEGLEAPQVAGRN
jgi:methyl-accepting chemotaxis protein